MCRRRIIAIILSLALVASCFVLSVSADENVANAFSIVINGVRYFLSEDAGFEFTINASSSYTINWTYYGCTFGMFDNLPVTCNFDLRFYIKNGQRIDYLDMYPSSYAGVYKTNVQCKVCEYEDWIDSWPSYDEDNYFIKSPYGYRFTCVVTESNYQMPLNLSVVWRNNETVPLEVVAKVENLVIDFGLNWFISSFYFPIMENLQTTLTAIKNAVESLNYSFVLDDNYSVNSIWYDQDGNVHIEEYDGYNWIDAMYGLLFNLSKPIFHQEQKEQLARDAGFEDVLDDAYDKSNPGDFLDFLSIGDIASWDEDAYEDAQGDAITYWFSQSCKDNIDSVPVVRGEEPIVIDFYSSHISEYWEALGIDTADSSGD